MKKAIGFMSGVAAVTLAASGLYMLTSDTTKKKACKTVHSALDDASKMVNKSMNHMNSKSN